MKPQRIASTFIVFIVFIVHVQYIVARPINETRSPVQTDITPHTKKPWGLKFESETQTIKDKKFKISGYESSLNINFYWMLSDQLGVMTEIEGAQKNVNNSEQKNTLDHSSFGLRYLVESIESPWKFSLLHHWEEVDRTLEFEIRKNFKISSRMDFKWRSQFTEYLTQKESILRKVKIELTPRYKISDFRMGPQLQWKSKFKFDSENHFLELNPFIEYQIDDLSLKIKQSFIPYQSEKLANNTPYWTDNSTTIFELEHSL